MTGRAAPLPGLTTQQRDVCADLLSIETGLNCFEDARLIIDSLARLVELGEPNINVVRWLTLMPRARAAAADASRAATYPEQQLTILTPLSEVVGTNRMPRGRVASGPVQGAGVRPASRVEREQRRKRTGVCSVCGCEFEQAAGPGRPAVKCVKHRGRKKRRAA